MKTKIFFSAILLILFIHCERNPNVSLEMETDLNLLRYESTISELGKLANPQFSDSIKLDSILYFKTIDLKGNIKSVDMKTAVELLNTNIEKDKPEFYPIFEIKNSSTVILSAFGQGLWDKIWAKVLIDTTSMKVIHIEFNHIGETPGIGGNINDTLFTNQFIGKTIELPQNNFSLYQNDTIVIKGKNRIDGLSGATITSKGVIEMLNHDLVKYKGYLR